MSHKKGKVYKKALYRIIYILVSRKIGIMAGRQPYITLPLALTDAIGWQAGDRIAIKLIAGSRLVLERVEKTKKENSPALPEQ